MLMKSVLFLVTLVSISYATDELVFDNLTATEDIEILSYGSSEAKDIRAIGRSYAHNLMENQDCTDYIDESYGYFDGEDTLDGVESYAKNYKMHVGVVGGGIILSLFLFVGFLLSGCCMICCNKTQKTESSMACWRMIWGTIIVVLLAANVAGILILIVSGQQILTLGSDTNRTIDTLGDGVVAYLNDTNAQMDTLKENQFQVFVDSLTPLVDNAINDTVDEIKDNTNLTTGVQQIVAALDDLDTTLDAAITTINEIADSITSLSDSVDTINANLGTCSSAITNCGATCTAQVDVAQFTATFDTSELTASAVTTIRDSISDMETFNDKTLAEWSTFVDEQWSNLWEFVWNSTESARADYRTAISDAQDTFETTLNDDVQSQLTSLMDNITTYQEDSKVTLTATLDYMRAMMLLQNGSAENVPSQLTDITEGDNGDFVTYVIYGMFCFVVLLVVLLLLTVIIGIGSTILGCCKVDDELLPTERKSGCCGCLLMSTSYCSVILCAIATIAAALMCSVVMLEEGLCKQYDDGSLLDGISDLGETLNASLDIGELLEEQLGLTDMNVTTSSLMKSCKNGDTIISALGITQSTEVSGFSIDSLKGQIDDAIEAFNVSEALDSLDIEFDIIDADAQASLANNSDALTDGFDYSTVQSYLSDTDLTGIANISGLLTTMQTLIDTLTANSVDTTDLQTCKTGLVEIQTLTAVGGDVPEAISNLSTSLGSMETVATNASDQISSFIAGIVLVQDTITNSFVVGIVKPKVEAVITSATTSAGTFIDWLFVQFQTTIGSCQPLAAVYETIFNYTCDGIFIHTTLLYCSLSLIGISLFFYMCVARCMARYFIKYNKLHPDDEDQQGNGWSKDHSLTPISHNRVNPYPGHYSQTKL